MQPTLLYWLSTRGPSHGDKVTMVWSLPSPPSSTKIKNEWYCTSSHLHVFMTSAGQYYHSTSHECCSSGLPFTWVPAFKIWQQCSYELFQTSAVKQQRNALLWVITQQVEVLTFQDNLSVPSSGFKNPKGPTGCPETSLWNSEARAQRERERERESAITCY